MKLKDFLGALITDNVQVKLVDLQTNAEIITLKVLGYTSLEDTLENREVKQWSISTATSIIAVLGDVIQDTTEPSDP